MQCDDYETNDKTPSVPFSYEPLYASHTYSQTLITSKRHPVLEFPIKVTELEVVTPPSQE